MHATTVGLDLAETRFERLPCPVASSSSDLRSRGTEAESLDDGSVGCSDAPAAGPDGTCTEAYVLAASAIHADDTPIRVLAPGTGKTRRGHFWAYVRDERPWGSRAPPACWYQYSPDWRSEHPQ